MDSLEGLSLAELREQSVRIAWDYLRRSGQLGEHQEAARFLNGSVERWIRQGNRSRLLLSNKAVVAYRNFRMPKTAARGGLTIIYVL